MRRGAFLLLFLVSLLAPSCGGESDGAPDESVDVSEQSVSMTRRFDVSTTLCGKPPATCPAVDPDDKCLCIPEVDALNYTTQPHYLAVGDQDHKASLIANGNRQAAYIDRFSEGWTTMSAAAKADADYATIKANFPNGVPVWFLVNELSRDSWPTDASYRQWAIAYAKRLEARGRTPIMLAPFSKPYYHHDDWEALAKHAFIGAQVYLSGRRVKNHDFSVEWCRSVYDFALSRYDFVGVPASRLFLVEHFGSTTAWPSPTKEADEEEEYGRGGVSRADWNKVIQTRGVAAQDRGFAGFIAYGWHGNQMQEPAEWRHEYMATYASIGLPNKQQQILEETVETPPETTPEPPPPPPGKPQWNPPLPGTAGWDPAFDAGYYFDLNPDLEQFFGAGAWSSALWHWQTSGQIEGRWASPALIPGEYLANNSDLVAAYGPTNTPAAIKHFNTWGINEGRQGSPAFHAPYYLATHSDLLAAYGPTNYQWALWHWLTFGIDAGYRASPSFDPIYYLAANQDLANLFGPTNYSAGLVHWLRSGRFEGRIAVPPQ